MSRPMHPVISSADAQKTTTTSSNRPTLKLSTSTLKIITKWPTIILCCGSFWTFSMAAGAAAETTAKVTTVTSTILLLSSLSLTLLPPSLVTSVPQTNETITSDLMIKTNLTGLNLMIPVSSNSTTVAGNFFNAENKTDRGARTKTSTTAKQSNVLVPTTTTTTVDASDAAVDISVGEKSIFSSNNDNNNNSNGDDDDDEKEEDKSDLVARTTTIDQDENSHFDDPNHRHHNNNDYNDNDRSLKESIDVEEEEEDEDDDESDESEGADDEEEEGETEGGPKSDLGGNRTGKPDSNENRILVKRKFNIPSKQLSTTNDVDSNSKTSTSTTIDSTTTTNSSIDPEIDPELHLKKPPWLTEKMTIADNEDNNEDDYDEDEDADETYRQQTNVCTAGYFFDRIIPEDYPHEISKDVKHINETIERLNRMYTFSTKMLERLNPFIREMVSRMTDYIYESQLDSECMGALFRVFRAINQRKPWAMNFLDASGSVFVGGFQQGMFVSLGEFDQCLEIESDPQESSNIILGQYCLLKPVVPLPEDIKQGEPIAQSRIPRVKKFLNDEYIDTYLGLYKFMKRTFLRVGLCIPHKCERQSLENAINRILVRKTGMSVQVGPECVKATDGPQFNLYQIIALSLFLLLLILVLLSTTYEIIYRHLFENRSAHPFSGSVMKPRHSSHDCTNSFGSRPYDRSMSAASRLSRLYFDKPIVVQVLTSFSIIRNTRHLFDYPSPKRYPQLDTMRLLLILFFFISNAYYYTLVFAPMIIKRFYVQGPMQFVSEKKFFFIRMYYLLDCFVVFSGIALAISFRPKEFTYVRYILRNYVRYTLPILVSIGLIYVVPLLGSGPLWHLFDQTMTQPCKDNVWSTLLFVNNFHDNIEEICNLPTVFVSMIFQLKLIAPAILLAATYVPDKFQTCYYIMWLILTSMLNLFFRFYYDIKIPYEHRSMKSFTEIKQSVMFYFFNPLCHIQPLIVGLYVGHLIRTRPTAGRDSHVKNGIIGTVCLVSFLICFIYTENLDLFNPQLGPFQLVLMLTIGRLMLVSLHSWIIYASITGHITIVNRFLSSIAFRPISQLSYGFFLTSIIVTCYRLFSIRQTIILSGQTMFRAIVSDAVISFFFAYFMHIMVQQPIRNLLQVPIFWRRIFPMNTKNSFTSEQIQGSYLSRTLSSLKANNLDKLFKVVEEVMNESEDVLHKDKQALPVDPVVRSTMFEKQSVMLDINYIDADDDFGGDQTKPDSMDLNNNNNNNDNDDDDDDDNNQNVSK